MHAISAVLSTALQQYAPDWRQTMRQALVLLGLGLGGVAAEFDE